MKIKSSHEPKTYRAYVVLAALNLLTIVAALFLTDRLAKNHRRSVAVSRVWTERVTSFNHLHQLAANVNRPINHVFASNAVEVESATLERQLDAFVAAIAAARKELAQKDATERAVLIRHLARTEAAVRALAAEGRGVFAALRAGDKSSAVAKSAPADRQFAIAGSEISELMNVAHRAQEARFREHERRDVFLRRAERVLALAILSLVLVMTFYARRTAGELRAAEERGRRFDGMRRLIYAFENTIEGIAFIDTNLRYSFVNFAYASACGVTRDDLLGRLWEESIHPDDREEWARCRAEVDTWGRAERELRGLRADGTTFHQRFVLVAAQDGGVEVALYCFMNDVRRSRSRTRCERARSVSSSPRVRPAT